MHTLCLKTAFLRLTIQEARTKVLTKLSGFYLKVAERPFPLKHSSNLD